MANPSLSRMIRYQTWLVFTVESQTLSNKQKPSLNIVIPFQKKEQAKSVRDFRTGDPHAAHVLLHIAVSCVSVTVFITGLDWWERR